MTLEHIVELLKTKVGVDHYYTAGAFYYVYFRCSDDEILKFLILAADAANGRIIIDADERGFYYDMQIPDYNADIIEHYLTIE